MVGQGTPKGNCPVFGGSHIWRQAQLQGNTNLSTSTRSFPAEMLLGIPVFFFEGTVLGCFSRKSEPKTSGDLPFRHIDLWESLASFRLSAAQAGEEGAQNGDEMKKEGQGLRTPRAWRKHRQACRPRFKRRPGVGGALEKDVGQPAKKRVLTPCDRVNYIGLTRPHPKWWLLWGIAPKPPYWIGASNRCPPMCKTNRPIGDHQTTEA